MQRMKHFKGSMFQTGLPRTLQTLWDWPLGVHLPPWPVLKQPQTLKKLENGHPKLRSRDEGGKFRQCCHCPFFLAPEKLERSTEACSRKPSSHGLKPQEALPPPSSISCRMQASLHPEPNYYESEVTLWSSSLSSRSSPISPHITMCGFSKQRGSLCIFAQYSKSE